MTDARRRLALGVVCLSVLVVSIDGLILNVALPTLTDELRASTSELQWIVDAYILAFASFLLVGGSLGDRFGRTRMMRVGLVMFGAASAFAAFSADATALVVCRGVMGIGAALVMPASLAVLTNIFTEVRSRARAFGVWAAVGGLGVALGPVVGGLLLSQFWWGSVFFVNVPIVVVALVGGLLVLPESRNPATVGFDIAGVVLSVLSVSALVWATIEAPSHGWLSATTLWSFAFAAALLACFLVWEWRARHPMIDLRFFQSARFTAGSLTAATANFAFTGALFVVTQLLQFVFGYSPLEAGLALAPLAVAFMIAGLLGPRLAERFGTKRAVAFGLAILALGVLVLASASSTTGYGIVLAAGLAIGGGFASTMAPNTDAVMGAVSRDEAGVASGTYSTTRQVSSAVGIAVVGSLLVSGYHSSLASSTRDLALSPADRRSADLSLGAALEVADRVGGKTGRALATAAQSAFIDGMRLGLVAAAGLLVVGVILALRWLPATEDDAPDVGEEAHVVAMDALIVE